MLRVILFFLLLTISTSTKAICAVSIKLEDEIEQTKHIFIAKITMARISKEDKSGNPIEYEAEFKVLKMIKDSIIDFKLLKTGIYENNYRFVPGFNYFIFTNDGNVGGCLNSTMNSSYPITSESEEFYIKSIQSYIKNKTAIDHKKLYKLMREYALEHADDQI